ncbi:MAG: FkbM family methyltransferase [Rhodobacteraceae bacterium]|nr:FkbM family methyltransferase [Paracoccaceae bacterium]MCY4137751.1 FkbM family methyltransferase [Paracoccaceae bacterium]
MRRLRARPRKVADGFLFSGHKGVFLNHWETGERKFVSKLLPNVDLFVNFGAHHGYYCCMALKANVQTIAFEPIPENCAMIAKNVRENGLEENFSLFPMAVSNKTGIVEMYGLNRPTTSLLKGCSPTSHLKTWHVPVHKIDDVVQASAFQGKKILVLMDIEGSEAFALECGKTLLNSDPKPIWIIEIFPKKRYEHSPAHRVFEMMFDAGYIAFSFDDSLNGQRGSQSSLVEITGDVVNLRFEEGGNFVFCSNEMTDAFAHLFRRT